MISTIIKKSVPLANYVALSLLFSVALTIFILLIRNTHLPPQIPLFYGLAQGESQLASTSFIFLPIAISVGLLFINIIVSMFLKDDFLKKAMVASGILTIAFSTITILRIVFLVGSL